MSGQKIRTYPAVRAFIRKELPWRQKLFLVTEIDAEIEGDTYFPEFDVSAYERTVEEIVDGEIPYSYVTYSKKKTKIFIDGSEGTTGLRINERFAGRDDLEILHIDLALRKDTEERKKLINASDITILCLPDAAAKEAVSLVENENVRILDASTAHRTEEGWAYGFPELGAVFPGKNQNRKKSGGARLLCLRLYCPDVSAGKGGHPFSRLPGMCLCHVRLQRRR